MKYSVSFRVDARYVVDVEADNVAEARELARAAFCDADFGVADDVDGKEVHIENEYGEYVY